jgi:16S rRNA (uracil1498-N3)-methyltransferase
MAHVARIYVAGHLGAGPLRIEGEQAKRLSAVMRMRPGERFLVFSGDGREWEAEVVEAGKGVVMATVGAVARQAAPPELVVELWVAIVRPNRFDWAVEKAVEAGADVIRPLIAQHSARGEGSSAGRQERWTRIAVEAAEQCGRLHLCVVERPGTFDDLLHRHHGTLVVADREGKPWREITELLPEQGQVAVAVGPEGGFSPEEVARAKAAGALLAKLGPNILRTETAAVLATGMLRGGGRG